VEVLRTGTTYELAAGSAPLTLLHNDEELTLEVGGSKTLPLAPVPRMPRPVQPPGRAPVRRHP
jgi:alpha,alpha-trehalose phosphorylase